MKTAHIYPGLRYKSRVMQPQILADRQVQQRLNQASELAQQNIASVWQTRRPFTSTRECFVATLAAQVAVGIYYNERHRNADVIVASSFGHYAALAMTGALSYQETLELAKTNGEVIDNYFADHATWMIRDIPLSLPFHTDQMLNAEKATHSTIEQLSLRPLKIPLVSTYYGTFAPTHSSAIRHMMKHQMSSKNRLIATIEILRRAGIEKNVHIQTYDHREYLRKKDPLSFGLAQNSDHAEVDQNR